MTIRHGSRGRLGQAIYQIMLILACAAMAIAATFPILDYLQNYRGEVQESRQSAAPPAAGREPSGASTTTTLAPAAAAPAATPTPTTTTVPATPAPAPAEKKAGG